MSVINQKEYLKKYLSIGVEPGERKKKKKKKKAIGDRVKIIDDDVDVSKNFNIPEEELFAANEEAPQIVGVIDERPPELRLLDYRQSDVWKPVGEVVNDHIQIKDTAKKFSMTLSSKQSKNASNSGNVKKENKTDLIFSRNIARRNSNEDVSPPRRRDKDISPPRKFRRAEDVSPPRKSRRDEDISPPRKSQRDRNISPTRKYPRDEDVSPPRKSRRDEDISPPRKLCRGEDSSSPKRKEKGFSPQGQRNEKRSSSSRKRSPLKNEDTPSRQKKKSRWSETASPEPKRMTKTLDGKTAGLQNAKDLAIETEKFKERENNLFENMSAEQSGINATTVVRDRKTGKVRDLEREQEEKKKKQEEEDKNKEKYSKWGRGLKQVEDIKEKITQDLHEMNKPLARYADDEDLERYLKEQERDDDPMLAYIRKKKRKEAVVSGKPMKPTYEGEFMPNRYGIRPGYRWDGVDRSNGYEKKWFEVQNAKTAQQEEVYKWSTEDM